MTGLNAVVVCVLLQVENVTETPVSSDINSSAVTLLPAAGMTKPPSTPEIRVLY